MGSTDLVPAVQLRVRKLVLSTVIGHLDLLREIDLDRAPRERVAVVGESGSWKTLLGRTLVGVLPEKLRVRSGEIRLELMESRNSSNRLERSASRKYITMVPQIAASALPPPRSPPKVE